MFVPIYTHEDNFSQLFAKAARAEEQVARYARSELSTSSECVIECAR